ncbi:MAG: hypothetical protein GX606_06545 [Elusimicrobia bacterium]|nr:hypothetical protein [Elusimicrobiota bacterium]
MKNILALTGVVFLLLSVAVLAQDVASKEDGFFCAQQYPHKVHSISVFVDADGRSVSNQGVMSGETWLKNDAEAFYQHEKSFSVLVDSFEAARSAPAVSEFWTVCRHGEEECELFIRPEGAGEIIAESVPAGQVVLYGTGLEVFESFRMSDEERKVGEISCRMAADPVVREAQGSHGSMVFKRKDLCINRDFCEALIAEHHRIPAGGEPHVTRTEQRIMSRDFSDADVLPPAMM